MRNPIISIIIPVYNIEDYVVPCVKSVLAQDILKEIILVDDGSTDSSGEICDKLASENDCVRVIHKTNGGLSDARNMGLATATGDFVYFLDGDDRLLHRTLVNAVHDANRFDANVAIGGIHTVRPNIILTEWDNVAYLEFMHDRTYTGAKYIQKMLPEHDFRVEIGRYVFRRSFLQKTGLVFPVGLIHEDEYFSPRILLLCDKLYVCNYQIYCYDNSRESSIMHDPEKVLDRAKDSARIYDGLSKVYTLCPDKDLRKKLLDNLAWKYLAMVESLPQTKQEKETSWRWRILRYAHTPKRKIKAFAYSVSPRLYRMVFGRKQKQENTREENAR